MEREIPKAKKGDAVVVTLNHRLNVLGFLDLSAYGDKYAKSGNAGHPKLLPNLPPLHTEGLA